MLTVTVHIYISELVVIKIQFCFDLLIWDEVPTMVEIAIFSISLMA
jgi:hypothetical protein